MPVEPVDLPEVNTLMQAMQATTLRVITRYASLRLSAGPSAYQSLINAPVRTYSNSKHFKNLSIQVGSSLSFVRKMSSVQPIFSEDFLFRQVGFELTFRLI